MKKTILIVDNEVILEVMRKMLSNDFRILTARDGKDGLEKFKNHMMEIKLIITEESLPGMSGSEMIEEIVKINPNVPVIFMTDCKIKYTGGHLVVRKPFNVADLLSMIKTMMSKFKSDTAVLLSRVG